MGKPLNPKQLKFVERYLATGNATQSYIDAGYTARGKSATNAASVLLENDGVKAVVDAHRAKATEKQGITAEWYAERVKTEAERDGEGSSHGARVSALRLAGELLGVGTPAPPPQDGLSFDAVIRILATLAARDPAAEPQGDGDEGVDETLI